MASMSDKGTQLIGEINATVKKAVDPILQGLTLQSATLELIIARLDSMGALSPATAVAQEPASLPKAAVLSDEAAASAPAKVKTQSVNIYFATTVKEGNANGFRDTYVTDAVLADLKLKRPAELSANPSEDEKKANIKAWGTVATKVWAKIPEIDRACIKKVQAASKSLSGSEAATNLVEDE